LGLHGRKGLWFLCAQPILGEVERISRIWAATELIGGDANTSPWSMVLFIATAVQLTISDRGRLCSRMATMYRRGTVREEQGMCDTAVELTESRRPPVNNSGHARLDPRDGATSRFILPRDRFPSLDHTSTSYSTVLQIFYPRSSDICKVLIFSFFLNRPPSILSISRFLLRTEQTSLIKFVHLTTFFKLTIGYLDQNRVNSKIWHVQFGPFPL
jgi:hypothetical protein